MSDSQAVFNQINLVVHDMEATLAFYRRLGLDIPDATVWRTASGGHHVEVRMPSGVCLEFDSLELARSYNAGWREQPVGGSRSVLGFSVESRAAVDQQYAALVAAGYKGSQPPYDTFWGARYAVVEDPDGNHVGLMSPLDPARRRPPPAL
jgi:catechol 2,3-dioxygenase-like lactoylglutathione lyase family enzyme